MARKIAAVVFSLGCLQAGSVMALGLGEMKLDSFLNQPLKASVDLLNTGSLHPEEIKIRLATREDFQKLGIDRAYFLTSIIFDVVVDADGRAQIVMTSEDPVLEPYLDFIVEARWPEGRLLREYTVLIDPPVYADAAPTRVVSASQRVEEVEGIPAPEKKTAVASTGTTVDVRQSDLAAGAMPQRGYSSDTAPTPMAGTRYMISRDQTLWEIASQAKPSGVSVHQTMLDIQRLNPDAFINGNINRIKAGYIIYLPSAAEISSGNLDAALAEVREQNSAWREGRDAQAYASAGPALRISADDSDTPAAGSGAAPAAASESNQAVTEPAASDGGGAATDASVDAGTDSGDDSLAALQAQVDTLQRIVSLKDEQISALQTALESQGAASDALDVDGVENITSELEGLEVDIASAESLEGIVEQALPGVEEGASVPAELLVESGTAAEQEGAIEATVEPESEPKPEPKVKPAPVEVEESGGMMSYLLYGLGALVLAVIGFVFARRRSAEGDAAAPAVARKSTGARDVFSDVQLRDNELEVEPTADDQAAAEETAAKLRTDRGYGQRKHDEYASDVEAADALAEADIYIAYGRHTQAIDLLNNALGNEPGNPVYRLKLLEIYAEQQNRGAATAQFEKLQAIGDADSTARAEVIMRQLDTPSSDEKLVQVQTGRQETARTAVTDGPGLSPNPLDLTEQSGEALEADFSGLAIEDSAAAEDDLDLSADFAPVTSARDDGEELVIADDANGLSTKLDLARAYMDMGDDEGARQILEEVVAEGSDDLKAEARALLDRIG